MHKSKKLKICEVCGITNEANIAFVGKNNRFKKVLCNKHYRQLLYRGQITDPSPQFRNQMQKNEYVLYDEYAEICLYARNGKEAYRTVIDLDDVEKCKQYKWREIHGYVITDVNRKKLYIHRFLMNPPDNLVIDHIDKNPMNNRKNNLRICTTADNRCNISKQRRNKSGILGVYWNKGMKKWGAFIKKGWSYALLRLLQRHRRSS